MQTCKAHTKVFESCDMTHEYDMIHFHTRLQLPVKIESLDQHQIYCKHPDTHSAFVAGPTSVCVCVMDQCVSVSDWGIQHISYDIRLLLCMILALSQVILGQLPQQGLLRLSPLTINTFSCSSPGIWTNNVPLVQALLYTLP